MRTVFCRYCGCPKRVDALEAHCLSKHRSPKAALRVGDEPREPANSNWQKIIEDLDHTVPLPVVSTRAIVETVQHFQDPKNTLDSTTAPEAS
jgi:hypothetical protein